MDWRETGYPGYTVSSDGRVRGPRGRVLSASPTTRGYLRVTVHCGGRIITRTVHVLVCGAYHGPKPSPAHHAAHLDGDQRNNTAANLAWKLPVDNEADKIRHGTYNHHGERNPHSLLRREDVEAIRAVYRQGGTSQEVLARQYGVRQEHISRIVRYKNWPDA